MLIRRTGSTAASNEVLRAALEEMCYQFAYDGAKNGWPILHTGGLSALEEAFEALGWDDPYKIPDPVWCDAPVTPRCPNRTTSGTPTKDGYKRFCSDHFDLWQQAAREVLTKRAAVDPVATNQHEPSWDCPIHGGAIINRCDCGRFVRPRFCGEPATSQVSDPERTEE